MAFMKWLKEQIEKPGNRAVALNMMGKNHSKAGNEEEAYQMF